MRRLLTALAVSCAALGATASPSLAILGGQDAAAGEGALREWIRSQAPDGVD